MTAASGFPPSTVYPIVGVSKSKPGVVTLNSFTMSNGFTLALGQTLTISGVQGMFQLNDNRYIAGSLNADALTFCLFDLSFNPVDTTSFTPYISGGEIDIISFPPTATNPAGLMYNQ